MEFKDRIKMLREGKGLNLTQLAVAFDLKEAGVRAWELGRTKPNADTLIKLAQYFNCTTDYLLGLSDIRSYSVDKKDIEIERLRKMIEINEKYIQQLKEGFEKSLNIAKEATSRLSRVDEIIEDISEKGEPDT